MKKTLEEKLLSSDFTFGFELEAKLDYRDIPVDEDTNEYSNFLQKLYDEGYNASDLVDDFMLERYEDVDEPTYGMFEEFCHWITDYEDTAFDVDELFYELLPIEIIKYIVPEELDFKKYFPDGAKWIVSPSKGIAYDGSLGNGGFEWRSPIMKLTPESVSSCIAFLKKVRTTFIVDKECGFHTHLSFNGITEDDAMWLTMKLAMDEKEIKELEELTAFNPEKDSEGTIFMYSNKYSSDEYLSKLRENIYGLSSVLSPSIEDISKLLTNEKYRLLRIHPQGTMEWRGPRDFLSDYYGESYIKSFFLKIYNFVNWMRNALDSKELPTCDIERDNLLELIKSYKKDSEGLFGKRIETADEKLLDKLLKKPQMLFYIKNLKPRRLMKVFNLLSGEEIVGVLKNVEMFMDAGRKLSPEIFACLFLSLNSENNRKSLVRHWPDVIPYKYIKKYYNYDGSHHVSMMWEFEFRDIPLTKEDRLEMVKESTSKFNMMMSHFYEKWKQNNQITGDIADAIKQKYNMSDEDFRKYFSK